jgi:phospholipid/cholesterol/gamma-HCH transport system ATP-binding protein
MTHANDKQDGVSIVIRDVWKSYDGHTVLRGIRLDVAKGETLVILGGSGEGKSVLIRQIIGLEAPDRGEIRLNDLTVEDYRKLSVDEKPFRASMVFQSSALLNSLSVADNVSLALREHRMAKPDEIRRTVRDCLARVDMEGTEGKLPSELSGGMRKRVAIARALAVNSDLILYDEPTAELDPLLTEEVGKLIRRIQDHRHPTQVVVTHNLPLAGEVADHIALLRRGEIVDYGTGEEFFHSQHPQTREFLRAARLA